MTNQSLPSVDAGPVSRQQAKKPPAKTAEPEAVAEGYLSRRLDLKMGRKHAVILRDKLRLLEDSAAQLEDGTFVSDRTKAMLWILENEVSV